MSDRNTRGLGSFRICRVDRNSEGKVTGFVPVGDTVMGAKNAPAYAQSLGLSEFQIVPATIQTVRPPKRQISATVRSTVAY